MARTQGRPADLATRQPEALADGDIGDADVIPMRSVPAMRIQTQHVTAQRIAVPRDLKRVEASVRREAELCGQSFMYSWRQGGETIEGVSIDGAMIMLRNFGNAVCDIEIAEDAPTHWVFKATFLDLETGFTLARPFRQRKSEKHGKYDDGRATDIAMQIGVSKAQRNVIVKAMPSWLTDAAIRAAFDGAEAKIENVPKEAEAAIAGFVKFGVTEEMIVKRLGAPRGAWVPRDIVSLKGLWAALRDRHTTVEQEFPRDEAPAPDAKPVAEPPAQTVATPAPAPKAEESKPKAKVEPKKRDLPVCGEMSSDGSAKCTRPAGHDAKHHDEATSSEW